jgi:lipoprotein LprG
MALPLSRRVLTAVPLPGLVLGLLLGSGLLSGCGGGQGDKAASRTPAQALAAAKKTLDGTAGVRLKLTTTGLPDSVSAGIIDADGVVTQAPAFEGTISVRFAGQQVDVPVISTGGTVYAQLPFSSGYEDIDPKAYGAPDPAHLISADSGFSSLLPATTGLRKGKSVRGGTNNEEVLTTYSGRVPGAAMKKVIPSAQSGGDFAAAYQVSDADELREATFTGVFYAKAEPMTYRVELTDYGTEKNVTAPPTKP